MDGSTWSDVFGMLSAPFTQPLDLFHLVLILVVILVLSGMMALVLEHVRLAATVEV